MTLLDNGAIAERLETLAALLDLAGASYYSVRAYRRAAELVRATPAPVAELVRGGRVRALRGIGPAIEARLVELVETGRLAEIDELEAEVQPELVALGRLVGLGPQRMVDLGRSLGVTTVAGLREAAEAGRLRAAPGIGPATEEKIRAALERPRATPRRSLLLNRSRQLVGGIAHSLGGVAAGDPRRWRDASEQLAVVVASDEPAVLLERFQALPEIVAIVEREERRALGVTVEGIPIELVVAAPSRFGTELLRATGSRARGAPGRRRRSRRVRRARRAVPPARAARAAVCRRSAAATRAGRDPRRPARAHDVVGRQGVGARDGSRGA